MNRFWKNNGLQLAWVVALVATLGSLYFSEILGYNPCKLCWIQRIFMYPLVILLGIAALKQDNKMTTYVLALSIPGGLVAIYHNLYIKTDWFRAASSFCEENPCDFNHVNWFGFITIPLMSLTAFVLITVICFLLRRAVRNSDGLHFSM